MDPNARFPYWAHGGISHRRREDAMLVQMCGSARLRRAGVHHVTRLRDASNAFYCVHKLKAGEAADELVSTERVDM
eukprot:2821034-Pyramimonas_sp.AAC.1